MSEPKLYQYRYPHPAVAADCVIFGWDGRQLNLLLIERGGEPYKGCWAFPGGFVEIDEDLDAGARRELWEETALKPRTLKQFQTFGEPRRDPRERVISVAYFSLVDMHHQPVRASSDAKQVQWFPLARLPKLAFDHSSILGIAKTRLQIEATLHPIGLGVLPAKFSGQELGRLYSTVFEAKIRGETLAKRLIDLGLVKKAARNGKAPALYAFDRTAYTRMERKGLTAKVLLPLA